MNSVGKKFVRLQKKRRAESEGKNDAAPIKQQLKACSHIVNSQKFTHMKCAGRRPDIDKKKRERPRERERKL